MGLLPILAGALSPGLAWATSPSGAEEDEGLLAVLTILVLVAVAYLLAHFFVERLQRWILGVSGLEYILLGVLLGPVVAVKVHVFDDLTALAPVIAFAAGWVGLLYGMELDLRTLLGIPDRSVRLALFEGPGTAVTVAVATWFALSRGWLGDAISEDEAAVAAMVLGCSAAAGSSTAVELLRAQFPALKTELLDLLSRGIRLGDMLAIIGFGMVFCLYHEGETRTENPQAFSDWVLITVLGLGLGLGLLFSLFLGRESSDNARFLALSGIILFASGAAFFLNLSALLVNMLLGAVVVNTRHGSGVFETLKDTQKPVHLVLLVFAGALWVPVPVLPAVGLAAGYMLVRTVSKAFWCWVCSFGTPLRSDLFRGMMAQGNVALAMAISFKLVYSGPAVDLVYTAILAGVVVHQLIAPRLLKGLLVDAGELRQDVDPPPALQQIGS